MENIKVLHYILGLPPYRSGGLTKYAIDLASEQRNLGYRVAILYPSGVSIFHNTLRIKPKGIYKGMNIYEMRNPLPISLLHGVRTPYDLMDESHVDKHIFEKFLTEVTPDVIHIHTLMGLPKFFLKITKERHIKTVYTTHDYYGLCFKANFINSQNEICSKAETLQCTQCNSDAPSTTFLKLRNEPFMTYLKPYFNCYKSMYKGNVSKKEKHKVPKTFDVTKAREYTLLQDYYKQMFSLIDMFHFNSNQSKSEYIKHMGGGNRWNSYTNNTCWD